MTWKFEDQLKRQPKSTQIRRAQATGLTWMLAQLSCNVCIAWQKFYSYGDGNVYNADTRMQQPEVQKSN